LSGTGKNIEYRIANSELTAAMRVYLAQFNHSPTETISPYIINPSPKRSFAIRHLLFVTHSFAVSSNFSPADGNSTSPKPSSASADFIASI